MAESEISDEDDFEEPLSLEEQMEKVDREGLIDYSHFDLFIFWWQMGGSQRGLSPMEIAEMPAAMIKDFLFLMSKYSEIKKKLRKEKGKIRKND